jgi:hypothetical protein
VIHYASGTLQAAETKWCTREKEALAIVWACQVFRPYLIGYQFLVETDHQSLKWLMEAKSPARLVRWALQLSEYDFVIRHKKGDANSNADALSRLPISKEIFDVDENLEEKLFVMKTFAEIGNISKEQKKDAELRVLFTALRYTGAHQNIQDQFAIVDQVLYRKKGDKLLVVIPKQMRALILKEYHDSYWASHASRVWS